MAGVALGVAVLFASLSAGATMDAAVARAAADEMGRAAVRVEALEEHGLSRDSLAAIAGTAGVDVVAPALERKTYLAASPSLSPAAEPPAPVPVLGIDAVAEPKLHDLPLSGGRLLTSADSGNAVITETLASQERLRIGDSITLNGGSTGPAAFSIVGIVSGDGSVPDAAGRLVIVPLASAQALFDMTGVTRVDLSTQPGVTASDLIGHLEETITTEPYLLARTSDTADSLRAETVDFRGTLLLVAAVVLFAGAFLIFNTLSMTVTERLRDVGLLRAAGATRSQVMGLVMLQAFALGAIGSVVGVVGGIGLASLTLSWVNATGPIALDAPNISLGSIVLALVIGVLITLAASLEPAWRAGRIPPVEALRRSPRGAVDGGARLRWLVLVFGVLAVAALAVWPSSSSGATQSTQGSGRLTFDLGSLGPLVVYGLMLVAVLIVPLVLGPLLRLAGIPFRIFRNEERLARSSLARDISRTTLTAGALVMGLAMVVALGTAAQNIRQIGERWLAETIPGSELLTSIHPISPTDSSIDDIATLPGVQSISPIGLFGVPFGGVRQQAAAISGEDFSVDGRLVFVPGGGDPAAAFAALDTGGAVIVPQSLASASDIRLGDTLSFATGETPTRLIVVGIVAHSIPGDSQEAMLMGWSDALGPFGATGADVFAVRYKPGQEPSARAAVDAAASQYALQSADLGSVQGTVGEALDGLFRLLDALALIAVLVAGLGMVNTLSMSVLERVREIGVLRATGMSSRQVWGMVVIEAGILGVAGSLIGAAVGLLVGGLLVAWSSGGFGLAFDPPWASIALAVLFGVLISVTASIYPAGVASRQSIVRALQHE